MKKSLQTIAKWLEASIQTTENPLVTGVSINTKTLQPGDLFIPFRGENTNGHQYVEQAFEKGAVAALWQKDEPNPPADRALLFVDDSELALQQMARAYRAEHTGTFIGITGSNGKTSTKDLVAGLLSPYFRVQKTQGNLNNQLGVPLTILSVEEDTEMIILEMGMSGFGEIEFLSTLARPHYAVITNIGEAHMQDLGSREGIAKAKSEIVTGLPQEGVFIYDGDEPLLVPHVESFEKKKVAFGFDSSNEITAAHITMTEKGSEFDVSGLVEGHFVLPVLGKHQVKNALVALTLGHLVNLSTEQMQQAFQHVELTDMRMQLVPIENGPLFINDAYNAAPTSMRAAIAFMKESSMRPKKCLLLGDMLELGENEQAFHADLVNDIPEQHFAAIYLFGPRMKWLYEQLTTRPEECVYWTEDMDELIDMTKHHVDSQSIVLVKGSRGMKLERVIEAFQA